MNYKTAKEISVILNKPGEWANVSKITGKNYPTGFDVEREIGRAEGFLGCYERAEKVIKAAQKVLDESWVHSEASAMEGLDSAVKEWRRENGGENV